MEHEPGGTTRRDFLYMAAGLGVATLIAGCEVGRAPGNPPGETAPSATPHTSRPPVAPTLTPTSQPSSAPEISPTSTLPPSSPAVSERPTAPPPAGARNLPPDYYIVSGPEDKPNVCITVDDFTGSIAPAYLRGLLQLGRQKDTRFTFFPIGQALQQQFDNREGRRLLQQARDDGHIIGNHTWDHDENLAKGTKSHIESELDRQQQQLNRLLGRKYDEFLLRPPGGSGGYHVINPTTKAQKQNEQQFQYLRGIAQDLGYWVTMWTTDSNDKNGNMVTPGDTPQQQDDRFLNKIFNGADGSTYEAVGNGSIILVHPTTLSLNGMARLIDGLHDRGYACVSVPGLFAA